MPYFEDLFKKIQNQEKLSNDELMTIERALKMEEYYEHILDIEMGLEKNDIGLKMHSKLIKHK